MFGIGMVDVFVIFLFLFGVYVVGRFVRLLNLLIKYLEQHTK